MVNILNLGVRCRAQDFRNSGRILEVGSLRIVWAIDRDYSLLIADFGK